jgi:hypothetical protein
MMHTSDFFRLRHGFTGVALGICVILFSSAPVLASDFASEFKDTLDNRFDISVWLSRRYGFMPIVSLITEPAVGPGATAGLGFLHRDKRDLGKPLTSPPGVSAVFGMYTTNESWAVGGGHAGFWIEDRIRYRGGAGYASVNLTFHPKSLIGERLGSIDFNLKGGGLMQELSFRIRDTRLFLGAKYIFFKDRVTFEFPIDIDSLDIGPWEIDAKIGGLGAVSIYDSRDNIFTPEKGIRAGLIYMYYDPIFGGDPTYQRLDTYALGFHPLSRSLHLGVRLDGRFSFGDAPFYTRPYIDLRGIPAMRYQGEYTLLAETEWRWDFTHRWSLNVFGGVGHAVPLRGEFSEGETVWNAGTGFRYFLARLFGIRAGIDVARGPEDWAVYIIVGSAWGKY